MIGKKAASSSSSRSTPTSSKPPQSMYPVNPYPPPTTATMVGKSKSTYPPNPYPPPTTTATTTVGKTRSTSSTYPPNPYPPPTSTPTTTATTKARSTSSSTTTTTTTPSVASLRKPLSISSGSDGSLSYVGSDRPLSHAGSDRPLSHAGSDRSLSHAGSDMSLTYSVSNVPLTNPKPDSDRTSSSSSSTETGTGSGYHTSVSTMPLSPVSVGGFESEGVEEKSVDLYREGSEGLKDVDLKDVEGSSGLEDREKEKEEEGGKTPKRDIVSLGLEGSNKKLRGGDESGKSVRGEKTRDGATSKTSSKDHEVNSAEAHPKDVTQQQQQKVKLPMTPNSVGSQSPIASSTPPPLPPLQLPTSRESISEFMLVPPGPLPTIPSVIESDRSTSSVPFPSLPEQSPTTPHPHPQRRDRPSRNGTKNPEHEHEHSQTHSHSHTDPSNSSHSSHPSYPSTNRAIVDELLDTMKQLLGTLGATFDVLGEQTVKVSTLPAALEAVERISTTRQALASQHAHQETRMQDVKTLMMEEVRTKLYGRLRERASEVVGEVVRREVGERVRRELYEQIPQKLRDDVVVYKRQIMEVRVSLHNSEARRHNALIRSNSLDEPLMPLLRPPPVPLSLHLTIPTGTGRYLQTSGGGGGGGVERGERGERGGVSAYVDRTPTALPLTARVFSESAVGASQPFVLGLGRGGRRGVVGGRDGKRGGGVDGKLKGVGEKWRGGGGGGGYDEPTVVTPSPLFPRDLKGLMRMGGEEAKALLREYGLVRVRYGGGGKRGLKNVVGGEVDGGEKEGGGCMEGSEREVVIEDEVEEVEEEEEETREERINRFLAYIGVGFQVVSSPADAPAGVVNLARVK